MQPTYVPAFALQPEKKPLVVVPPDGFRTPSFIKDVAAGKVELPTIPRIVQQLIAQVRDPLVDTRRISESLSRDPVMSAKVLRLANSAFFGGQRSMASIDPAISMIGTEALARLIIACGVSSSFSKVPGVDLQVFWQDSLVAAMAATELAARIGADPEEAYTCGLIHAVGHLILCQAYPDIALAMFGGFEVVRGAELAAIELGAFGIDHLEAGSLWAETLGFPQRVVSAIRHAVNVPDGAETPLESALRSACSLAASVAEGKTPDEAVRLLPPHISQRCIKTDTEGNVPFQAFFRTLQEAKLTS